MGALKIFSNYAELLDAATVDLPTINTPLANALTAIEGTAIKSTGEAGGTKFLREDGDNSCSWQTIDTSGDFSDGGEVGGADRTLGNTDNYDLGFLTNNVNRLHIQNDGSVGIGTTSPGDVLHVKGGNVEGVKVESSAQSAHVRLYSASNALNYNWGLACNYNATGFELLRSTNNHGDPTTPVLFADNSGNVGIGTTTPGAILDSLATTEQLRLSYDATNYATFTTAADGALTIATVDAAAADADLTLAPDGDLVLSPGSGLTHVSSGTLSVDSNQYLTFTGSNSSTYSIGQTTSDMRLVSWSKPLVFRSSIGENMRIDNATGNVGIGTASPAALLDVNGSVAMNITQPDLAGNSYTIAAGDYTVLIDDDDADVSGTVVVALPAAATSTGRMLNIKKIGSSQTVQLDGNASEEIDGSTTQDITTQYNSILIQCDGTAWWIL